MQEKIFLIALKTLFPTTKIFKKSNTRTSNRIRSTKRTSNRTRSTTEPIKATKVSETKTKQKIPSLKMHEELLNGFKNEETSINQQIFNEYFNYHYPSFSGKDLYEKSK